MVKAIPGFVVARTGKSMSPTDAMRDFLSGHKPDPAELMKCCQGFLSMTIFMVHELSDENKKLMARLFPGKDKGQKYQLLVDSEGVWVKTFEEGDFKSIMRRHQEEKA